MVDKKFNFEGRDIKLVLLVEPSTHKVLKVLEFDSKLNTQEESLLKYRDVAIITDAKGKEKILATPLVYFNFGCYLADTDEEIKIKLADVIAKKLPKKFRNNVWGTPTYACAHFRYPFHECMRCFMEEDEACEKICFKSGGGKKKVADDFNLEEVNND